MKKIEEPRLAQIVDYDIHTGDCQVAFRYMNRLIKGVTAFVWLTPEQKDAVMDWWVGQTDETDIFQSRVFSLRKKQLPEELQFWPKEIVQKGNYITERQGLMGCEVSSSAPPPYPPKPVKHYKKGEAITSKPGEEFTMEGYYVMDPQSRRPTKRLRRFAILFSLPKVSP